jgi:phage terminase small subunit
MEQKEPKLTPKQSAFVDAYLANGGNGTQACITAGYSVKTAQMMATENLLKPLIKKAIESRQNPIKEKFKVTREYIVEKLINVLNDDVKDSVYIKAIEVLAKVTGLNEPEKIELKTTMSPIKFNIKFKNDGS